MKKEPRKYLENKRFKQKKDSRETLDGDTERSLGKARKLQRFCFS